MISKKAQVISHARARVIGLLLVGFVAVITAAAQKPTHPEIKELQSPQNPRFGFMLMAEFDPSLTPAKKKAFSEKLGKIIDVASKGLRRGGPAQAVAETAAKTLASSKTKFGIVALDLKGKLAAVSKKKRSDVSAFATAFCASSSLSGSGDAARALCGNVEHRAMTVQASVDTTAVMQPGIAVVAIDKFGHMGVSPLAANVYRGYIQIDGKTVVETEK